VFEALGAQPALRRRADGGTEQAREGRARSAGELRKLANFPGARGFCFHGSKHPGDAKIDDVFGALGATFSGASHAGIMRWSARHVHAKPPPCVTMSVSVMAGVASAAQKHDMPEAPSSPAPKVESEGSHLLSAKQLYTARTVLIFGEVTMTLAEAVSGQLLALASAGPEPIRVLLHSPGGHVEAADTIHDVLRFVRPRVRIVASGWVASAGALIYCAVPHPDRLALPNTRFLLHQPLGGVGGPASDVEIEARQILLMRERLNHLFADATGQPYEKLLRDTDRNHWMSATEAKDYGLVSRIVTSEREVDAV